jgi:hypothetical protein
LGVAVAALISAVLLAGALVVMVSLVLAAVVASLCVAVLHVPWSRHGHVVEAGSRPRTVIDGTATVIRTTERNARS